MKEDVLPIAARWCEQGRAFVVATVIETTGSSPRKAGSCMLIADDESLHGTVGGGTPESKVINRAKELMANRLPPEVMDFDLKEKDSICGGTMRVFLDPHVAAYPVTIAGAGHVSAALALLLQNVGFAVSVFDDRADRLALPAFASVRRVCAPWDELGDHLSFDANTSIVVMTPNHDHDFDVTLQCIGKPWLFLGVMGSSRKRGELIAFLRGADVDDATIDRIAIPVGLPIASQTPAEIAVSIAAQLIDVRAGHPS